MANKTRMIRKLRKAHKRKEEPGLQERLKRLSDSAPVVKLPSGRLDFDTGPPKSRETFWGGDNDFRTVKFKDK